MTVLMLPGEMGTMPNPSSGQSLRLGAKPKANIAH